MLSDANWSGLQSLKKREKKSQPNAWLRLALAKAGKVCRDYWGAWKKPVSSVPLLALALRHQPVLYVKTHLLVMRKGDNTYHPANDGSLRRCPLLICQSSWMPSRHLKNNHLITLPSGPYTVQAFNLNLSTVWLSLSLKLNSVNI